MAASSPWTGSLFVFVIHHVLACCPSSSNYAVSSGSTSGLVLVEVTWLPGAACLTSLAGCLWKAETCSCVKVYDVGLKSSSEVDWGLKFEHPSQHLFYACIWPLCHNLSGKGHFCGTFASSTSGSLQWRIAVHCLTIGLLHFFSPLSTTFTAPSCSAFPARSSVVSYLTVVIHFPENAFPEALLPDGWKVTVISKGHSGQRDPECCDRLSSPEPSVLSLMLSCLSIPGAFVRHFCG